MSERPSYDELATLVAAQACVIEELRAEVAELRRRLGRDSSNSSQPPSKDSIAAKAKRRKDLSDRKRSLERKPGAQPGHPAHRLVPTRTPDRTIALPAPQECSGCGDVLAAAQDAGAAWAQIWDVLPVVLEKTAFVLPARRCGCGRGTGPPAPAGAVRGAVAYGPRLNAAAVLLSSPANVPCERAAHLIRDLLGVPVSTGFAAKAPERLARLLGAAGFDAAMRAALAVEEVLCADETPVELLPPAADAAGDPLPGAPHTVVLRTPDTRLVWFAPTSSRFGAQIQALGVLDAFRGVLVRDDYAAWRRFDAQLARVQLRRAPDPLP